MWEPIRVFNPDIIGIDVKKTYQFKTRCKDDMVNSVN